MWRRMDVLGLKCPVGRDWRVAEFSSELSMLCFVHPQLAWNGSSLSKSDAFRLWSCFQLFDSPSVSNEASYSYTLSSTCQFGLLNFCWQIFQGWCQHASAYFLRRYSWPSKTYPSPPPSNGTAGAIWFHTWRIIPVTTGKKNKIK